VTGGCGPDRAVSCRGPIFLEETAMTQSGKPCDDGPYETAEVRSIQSDVRAMEEETRMFERDNVEWAGSVRTAYPGVVPGLRELLASCEDSTDLCARMQQDAPAESSDGRFLQTAYPRLQKLCADIRAQMHADNPPQGDAVRSPKR
jgi:hypothetical protein